MNDNMDEDVEGRTRRSLITARGGYEGSVRYLCLRARGHSERQLLDEPLCGVVFYAGKTYFPRLRVFVKISEVAIRNMKSDIYFGSQYMGINVV